MRISTSGSLDQLFNDMIGCRLIRIPHAKVDDVLAGGSGLLLEFTNDIENVGRQALDTPKLIVHDKLTLQGPQALALRHKKRQQTLLSHPHTVNAAWGT